MILIIIKQLGKIIVKYISSGDRTVPDPNGEDVFRHDSVASQSWALPVLAGYYVLACQADTTMNKDKFYQLANATARTVESTEPIYQGEGDDARLVGRTTDKIQIKIIDINALLQAIKDEKSQQVEQKRICSICESCFKKLKKQNSVSLKEYFEKDLSNLLATKQV